MNYWSKRKFLPLKYYRYRFEQTLKNRQYTWYNGRMVQEEGGCKEVARRLFSHFH